jgi:hypothetical protein
VSEKILDYAPKRRRKFPWKIIIGLCTVALLAWPGYLATLWLGRVIIDRRIRQAHDASGYCVLSPTQPAFVFDGTNISFGKTLPRTDADRIVEQVGLGGFDGDPVFVHLRRTKSGSARTVILLFNRFYAMSGRPGFFKYYVLGPSLPADPKGILSDDDTEAIRQSDGVAIRPTSGHPMILYYGQADAVDESHFSFDYEIDGKRGTIDGYLTDNPHPGWYEWVRLVDRAKP